MVVGEITAKLVADTSGFTSGINSAKASLQGMQGAVESAKGGAASGGQAFDQMAEHARRAEGPVTKLKESIAKVAEIGSALFGLEFAFQAIDGVARQLGETFMDNARAAAQQQAVLTSTGGAAGQSAEELDRFAEATSRQTAYSKAAVEGTQNLLLTFTNIQDHFPEATKATLDMAQALGEDTKSAAIQLGKALQDPIMGATALRRVGVALDENQKELIKNFVEQGDVAAAQKIILEEINKEFGNSAVMYGQTLPGSLAIAKNSIGELQASFVQGLAPALTTIVQRFSQWAQNRSVQDWMMEMGIRVGGVLEALQQLVSGFGEAFSAILDIVQTVGGEVYDAFSWIIPSEPHSPPTTQRVAEDVNNIVSSFGELGPGISTALQNAGDAVHNFADIADATSGKVTEKLDKIIAKMGPDAVAAYGAAQSAVGELKTKLDAASDAVDDQKTKVESLQGTVTMWKDKIQAANDAIKLQEAALHNTQDAISAYQDQIDAAQNHLDSMKDVVDQLQQAYDDAKKSYQDFADAQLQGTQTFSDQKEAIQESIDKTQLLMDQMKASAGPGVDISRQAGYQALNTQLEQYKNNLAVVQGQEKVQLGPEQYKLDQAKNQKTEMPFQQILAGLTQYKAQMNQLQPQIDAQTAAYKAQEQVVKAMHEHLKGMEASAKAQSEALQHQKDAIDPMQQQLQNAEGALADAKNDLATMKQTWQDLNGQLKQYQEQLKQIVETAKQAAAAHGGAAAGKASTPNMPGKKGGTAPGLDRWMEDASGEGVTAAVTWADKIKNKATEVKTSMEAWAKSTNGVKKSLDGLKGPLEAMSGILKTVLPFVANHVEIIYAFAAAWLALSVALWATSLTPITLIIGAIVIAVAALALGIYELVTHWGEAWRFIQDSAERAWGWLKSHVFDAIMFVAFGPLTLVIHAFGHDWQDVWNGIQDVAKGAWKWLGDNIFTPLGEVFTKDIPTALGTFKEGWGKAWDWAGGVVGTFAGNIKIAINDVIGFINRVIQGINDMAGKVPGIGFHIQPIPLLDAGGVIQGPGVVAVGPIKEAMVPLTGPHAGASMGGDRVEVLLEALIQAVRDSAPIGGLKFDDAVLISNQRNIRRGRNL